MSGPSVTQHVHGMRSGLTAQVVRVLKGTGQRDWGGTIAYRTGIDLLVSIHCPACCCRWRRTTGCPDPIARWRVDYRRSDPDAWWRQVRGFEAEHLASPTHEANQRGTGGHRM